MKVFNKFKIFSSIFIVSLMLLFANWHKVFCVINKEPNLFNYNVNKLNISDEVKENKILIKHEEIFEKLEYAPVLFNHFNHVKALEKQGCKICHPTDSEGKLRFVFPKEFLNIKDKEELKNLYHLRCIECHQKLKDQVKKVGPTRLICGECHINYYNKKNITYPKFDFDFEYHYKHNEKIKNKCEKCHHSYDINEKDPNKAKKYIKGKEESCYYCHDLSIKRGKDTFKIQQIVQTKRLNISQAFHSLCLNCHVENIQKGEKSGPIVCNKCHTGIYKSMEELTNVKRPDRGQKEMSFMLVDEAKMKGVLFNHKLHENLLPKCRYCHHERLEKCSNCHTLKGDEKANFVNLLTIYHFIYSNKTCRGCHLSLTKNKNECLSCHHIIKIEEKSQVKKEKICIKCHTGEKRILVYKQLKIEDSKIKPKKEVYIDIISKEFEKAYMPHEKIIKALLEINNKNKLALYFHNRVETICEGCHHNIDFKSIKDKMPKCSNCHPIVANHIYPKINKLQGAYHGQCIKCHEYLAIKNALKCDSCHIPKKQREKPWL